MQYKRLLLGFITRSIVRPISLHFCSPLLVRAITILTNLLDVFGQKSDGGGVVAVIFCSLLRYYWFSVCVVWCVFEEVLYIEWYTMVYLLLHQDMMTQHD